MTAFRIPPNELSRKHYDSVDELAKEIASFVKSTGKAATLATDFRWWAKCLVNPHNGHVLNVSIGFEGNFLEDDLIIALRKNDVLVTPFPGESWFYILRSSMC